MCSKYLPLAHIIFTVCSLMYLQVRNSAIRVTKKLYERDDLRNTIEVSFTTGIYHSRDNSDK